MNALLGKHIVNTRAVHQAAALDALLRGEVAHPVSFPCIAIRLPEDLTALDGALTELMDGHFEWLTLTSANTVYALANRLRELGYALRSGAFRTACIGPGTAEAARQKLSLTSVELPDEFISESLADRLPINTGDHIFLPESAIARPTLAARLTSRGGQVTTVTAYETVQGSGGADLPALLAAGRADAWTFTSSSAVSFCVARLAGKPGSLDLARSLPAVCIGPKTASTAKEAGFRFVTSAAEHTLLGLIATLKVALTVQNSPSGK